MIDHGRINAFSLALAVASMGVAVYAALSRPGSNVAATCEACDTQALREQIARLERRVETAERAAARGTVRRVAEAATESPRSVVDPDASAEDDGDVEPSDGADAPAQPRASAPHFVDFEISERGVSVTQSDNGAIEVRNTNAALAGEVIVVQARTEDGSMVDLPLTVPPAE